MLSLATASMAFSAPAAGVARPTLGAQMSAITPGDIGTTKPLGVYDPLNLMTTMPDKYRRWQVRAALPQPTCPRGRPSAGRATSFVPLQGSAS